MVSSPDFAHHFAGRPGAGERDDEVGLARGDPLEGPAPVVRPAPARRSGSSARPTRTARRPGPCPSRRRRGSGTTAPCPAPCRARPPPSKSPDAVSSASSGNFLRHLLPRTSPGPTSGRRARVPGRRSGTRPARGTVGLASRPASWSARSPLGPPVDLAGHHDREHGRDGGGGDPGEGAALAAPLAVLGSPSGCCRDRRGPAVGSFGACAQPRGLPPLPLPRRPTGPSR